MGVLRPAASVTERCPSSSSQPCLAACDEAAQGQGCAEGAGEEQ